MTATKRQPKQQTKQQILNQALTMIDGLELPRLADVLDSLGYTTGAGYQCWGTQTDFHNDLRNEIAQRPWVEDVNANLRNIRQAVRFCDPHKIQPRFMQLENAIGSRQLASLMVAEAMLIVSTELAPEDVTYQTEKKV